LDGWRLDGSPLPRLRPRRAKLGLHGGARETSHTSEGGEAVTETGEAALAYAKRGVPVLPLHWPEDGACSCGDPDCPSPGKHPLTEHGKEDASTDPEIIKR